MRRLCLFALLLPSVTAVAADRGGFYVSGSMGYAGHDGKADVYEYVDDWDWSAEQTDSYDMGLSSGPYYNFKLGALLGSRNLLYGTFGQTFFDSEFGTDKSLTTYGIGYSYYLFKESPSPFLDVAVLKGYMNFTADRDSTSSIEDEQNGYAMSLGLGYEISRHWQVEAFYRDFATNDNSAAFLDWGHDAGTFYTIKSYGLKVEYKFTFPYRPSRN